MTLAYIVAGFMLAGLVVYALSGGADFGGGLWDLLASGPRKTEQRKAIERALAPVWEVNHIWLIFVVVMLFGGFPQAFARISIALHLPLVLLLLGIVLRGGAFVFRQYGEGDKSIWGRVFAIASIITPILLGMIVGAITRGVHANVTDFSTYVRDWCNPFSFSVGLLALVLFAFLAAVYLANECTGELRLDFRKRALAAGIALGAIALLCGVAADAGVQHFSSRLFGSWWSLGLQLATAAVALAALGCLVFHRYRWARLLAIAQVVLVLGGWAAAQFPYLVAPDVTIASAAAPEATFRVLIPIVLVGSILLAPALYWLFRVFKASRA